MIVRFPFLRGKTGLEFHRLLPPPCAVTWAEVRPLLPDSSPRLRQFRRLVRGFPTLPGSPGRQSLRSFSGRGTKKFNGNHDQGGIFLSSMSTDMGLPLAEPQVSMDT